MLFKYENVEADAIEYALNTERNTVLCHIVNNSGGWGRGFVVPLGKKIPEAEAAYRSWAKAWDMNPLGETQFVQINKNLTVANMCAQDGYDGIPVRYWAITECMIEVFRFAIGKNADIIMPRIGCGLGGGSWYEVEKAITAAQEKVLPKAIVFDWK